MFFFCVIIWCAFHWVLVCVNRQRSVYAHRVSLSFSCLCFSASVTTTLHKESGRRLCGRQDLYFWNIFVLQSQSFTSYSGNPELIRFSFFLRLVGIEIASISRIMPRLPWSKYLPILPRKSMFGLIMRMRPIRAITVFRVEKRRINSRML